MRTKTELPKHADGATVRKLVGPPELAAAGRREWLVEDVLMAGSPAAVAGGRMDLTRFAVDLAVGLATGTSFLGHFPVPRQRRVALYCGDADPADVAEQVRLVAQASGADAVAAWLHWGCRAPSFRTRTGWEQTVREVQDAGAEVVVIDPVLRALRAGERPEKSDWEANRLAAACDAFLAAGVTPVITYQTGWMRECPAICHLSEAGVCDYVRQWVLFGWGGRPVAGAAKHRMRTGGLAGHDGEWDVTVSGGRLDRDFTGRLWQTTVTPVPSPPPDERKPRGGLVGSKQDILEAYADTKPLTRGPAVKRGRAALPS